MPLGGSLAAKPIVVLGGASLAAAPARKVARAVARAGPGLAIVIAGRPLATATSWPERLGSVRCDLGRPRAARGLPAGCAPTAIIRAAAGLGALNRHVLEVIAVVSLQVPEGKKHNDKNQNDNCGQADHDRSHRTIQHGMA